ncbi:MAG TPA: hypothetical protein PLY87_28625 [Planctomycetaceae bacterium]|nr:hypothetical protein [Planctomycetaceae bacterium]HQZ69099.1 hypothetical protein [Planctomycetaceae bacterium]
MDGAIIVHVRHHHSNLNSQSPAGKPSTKAEGKAYIQLTEAEAAFRIQKRDLSIRPIWHQKEERVLAHIFVCFLAYVLWKTLGQLCDKAGLGSEPRRVLAELSDIRSLDVVPPTRSGPEIRTRCISKPTDHQEILLEKLRFKLPSKIIQKQM